MSEYLVNIEHERLSFFTPAGEVKALNDVSFHIKQGEVLGIVGESGSGKSVTAYSLMGLTAYPGKLLGGTLDFNGHRINDMTEKEFQKMRGNEVSIIFQDPMTSLNPVYTIGNQIREVIRLHTNKSKKEVQERAEELLQLMMDLKDKLGMAIMMITHDLGVVASMCDHIAVMYAGNIVEYGTTDDIFYNPKHEYTKGLIRSIPRMDSKEHERLVPIEGTPVDMLNPPKGCPFASRCDECMQICLREKAPVTYFGDVHYTSCWMNQKAELEGGSAK